MRIVAKDHASEIPHQTNRGVGDRPGNCVTYGVLKGPVGLEKLTEAIIGCAITVHDAIGPGLLESAYVTCLILELRAQGLRVDAEKRLALVYRGVTVGSYLCADLVVEDSVVVEVKSVTAILPVHQAQLLTYLKLTGCTVGLLINFNVPVLTRGVRRLVRPDLYKK